MSFAQRLSQATRALRDAGNNDGTALETLKGLSTSLLKENVPVSEIHTVLGLALRSIVNSFLASKPASSELVAVIRKYVSLTIDASATKAVVGESEAALVDAALPLLILEDAFDAAPVSESAALWQVIEDQRDSVATIVNLNQSRFRMPLLRICSSLMRRLSRSQHTVLLGRILISLAYCFPLGDRSGVNMLGFFNTDAQTAYDNDDEDAALIASAAAATSSPAPPPTGSTSSLTFPPNATFSPNIDTTLSAILPSIACVPRAVANITTCRAALADVDKGEAASSEPFYRAFWRLQQYMSAPSKAVASAESWALFACTLRIVMRAFEKEDSINGGPPGVVMTPLSVVSQPPKPTAGGVAGATAAFGALKPGAKTPLPAAAAAAAPEEGEEPDLPPPPTTAAAGGKKGGAQQPPAKTPTAGSSSAATAAPPAPILVPLAAFVKPLFPSPEALLGFDAAPGISAAAHLPNAIVAGSSSSGAAAAGTTTSTSKVSSAEGGSEQPGVGVGVKYLTSSRLLKLELRDASLRRHVLLQALILLQYITAQRQDADAHAKALAVLTAAQNPTPSAAAATAAVKAGAGAAAAGVGRGGAAAKQAAIDQKAVNEAQEYLKTLRKPKEAFAPSLLGPSSSFPTDAAFLTNFATHLLRRTTSDGLAFAKSVTVVLQRENLFWRAWKQMGAPAFEKSLPPLPAAAAVPEGAGAGGSSSSSSSADSSSSSGVGMKRKFGRIGGGMGAGGAGAKRPRILAKRPLGWASAGLEVNPWDICADLSRVPRHAAEDYIAPMKTALDPDSGIEPEYYPCNASKAYVWRAYRSLASEKVSGMADSASLPFVDLICKLYGLKRPQSQQQLEQQQQQEEKTATSSGAPASTTEPSAAPGVSGSSAEPQGSPLSGAEPATSVGGGSSGEGQQEEEGEASEAALVAAATEAADAPSGPADEGEGEGENAGLPAASEPSEAVGTEGEELQPVDEDQAADAGEEAAEEAAGEEAAGEGAAMDAEAGEVAEAGEAAEAAEQQEGGDDQGLAEL